MSIERGRDPRDYALVAFGGAGPLHACELARALGIPRIIVPRGAGVASAIGLLEAERSFAVSRTRTVGLDGPAAAGELAELYAELETRVRDLVGAAGDPVAWQRHAHVRYAGQGFELRIPLPPGPIDDEFPKRTREAFDSAYEAQYGYAQPDQPVEGTDWFLTGSPGEALAERRGAVQREDEGADSEPVEGTAASDGPAGARAEGDHETAARPMAAANADPDTPGAEVPAYSGGGNGGGAEGAPPVPTGTIRAWLAEPSGRGAPVECPVFDRDALRARGSNRRAGHRRRTRVHPASSERRRGAGERARESPHRGIGTGAARMKTRLHRLAGAAGKRWASLAPKRPWSGRPTRRMKGSRVEEATLLGARASSPRWAAGRRLSARAGSPRPQEDPAGYTFTAKERTR